MMKIAHILCVTSDATTRAACENALSLVVCHPIFAEDARHAEELLRVVAPPDLVVTEAPVDLAPDATGHYALALGMGVTAVDARLALPVSSHDVLAAVLAGLSALGERRGGAYYGALSDGFGEGGAPATVPPSVLDEASIAPLGLALGDDDFDDAFDARPAAFRPTARDTRRPRPSALPRPSAAPAAV